MAGRSDLIFNRGNPDEDEEEEGEDSDTDDIDHSGKGRNFLSGLKVLSLI